MILQQLYQDAEKILGETLAPPMYDWKPVRWLVRLQEDGQLIGYQSLGGDKDNKRGLPHLVPYPGPRAGTVIRPSLIADTAAFVLGYAPEDKRVAVKHTAFKALIKRCAKETGNSDVAAIDAFLSQHDPTVPLPPEAVGMTAADLITFRVDERLPTDNLDVQAFWAKSARPDPEKGTNIAECLVTGHLGPVESSLPGMLKRIPGGQSAGVALISANAVAFESYGWERAQTSPISREAAERFTKSLNRLIEGEHTHLTIGGLVYVFWTKKEGGDDFFSVALQSPDQVRDMIYGGVFRGKQGTIVESDAFYALALSASGGRAVVRDWINTTVGNAQRCLEKWHDAQAIVDWNGTPGPLVGVQQLIKAAYRDSNKEATPAILGALVRCALHGEPVPRSLLAKVVFRCRAEQNVNRSQAMLIKACLVTNVSNSDSEKEQYSLMSLLDLHQNRPAYVCGRLLAELEAVQRASAYPRKLNATLIDRYFGAASTAPSTVFGVLLTQANKAHLPDLRKRNPPVYQALQKRLEEILDLLDAGAESPFPNSLPLREQAWFSLGFYHQRAADRKAALEARDRKNADLAELIAPDDSDNDAENGNAEETEN